MNTDFAKSALARSKRLQDEASELWSPPAEGLTPHHRVPEVSAQILRRSKVYLPTEQSRKFLLHSGETEESWSVPCFELHQQVYVTVRPKVLAQNRAKKESFAMWFLRQNSSS